MKQLVEAFWSAGKVVSGECAPLHCCGCHRPAGC